MGEKLRCKVCGKLAEDDRHFYKKKQLCNRHALQLRNHGKFLDNKLIINPERNFWTEEDKILLEDGLKNNKTLKQIAKELNRSVDSVQTMSSHLGLGDKYLKKNSIKYTAPYQDYNWCFERFINRNMSHQEMADELNVSKRVIQKWCVEKFHLDETTWKHYKKLDSKQRELIIVGTLGDGHIDKRPNQPMYIESHAIDEKDYLFWKYNILKSICKKEPSYYKENTYTFSGDKEYLCKPYYRINTKILDELGEIRVMPNIDKIKNLNEFQLSLLMLDDGNRDSLWHLCVAGWNNEEIECLLNVFSKYNIEGIRQKDVRYLNFTALGSKNIDEMILNNIPNDLDIVKKKITENNKIHPFHNSFYVLLPDDSKIGLHTYCKQKGINYEKIRSIIDSKIYQFNKIKEKDLVDIVENYL